MREHVNMVLEIYGVNCGDVQFWSCLTSSLRGAGCVLYVVLGVPLCASVRGVAVQNDDHHQRQRSTGCIDPTNLST